MPSVGAHVADLKRFLAENERTPRRERLTLMRLYEELRSLGYQGGYDAVRRHARGWQRAEVGRTATAFVPLSFDPGKAYQFDWSHEIVIIGGVTTTVKVAHIRLCHSRMFFVAAYPRETQEMVFDTHTRAFAFFGGACVRGIYDNMSTAVDAVITGKERKFNRRFLQMCNHYLVEPTACTPVAGWEKGQVENQVGLVRERFFTPRLRFASYEELNAWLLDRCREYARAHRHPELRERTVADVFEDEKSALLRLPGTPFDGLHAVTATVSKTLLVRFDYNKYSVAARALGRPVEVHAYADGIVIHQGGDVVAEHGRLLHEDGCHRGCCHGVSVCRLLGLARSGPQEHGRREDRPQQFLCGQQLAAGSSEILVGYGQSGDQGPHYRRDEDRERRQLGDRAVQSD